jgi:hypothetical protein
MANTFSETTKRYLTAQTICDDDAAFAQVADILRITTISAPGLYDLSIVTCIRLIRFWKFDFARRTAPVMRKRSLRSIIRSYKSRISVRARPAPRQKWGPWPNER